MISYFRNTFYYFVYLFRGDKNIDPDKKRLTIVKRWRDYSFFEYQKDILIYLFEKPITFEKFVCRFRGHPNGYNYYTSNPEATEPDYHCKDCDDYLG